MALKAKILDLSEVTDTEQALYKKLEDGTGYIIDVEPVSGFNLENVAGLKSTLVKKSSEIDGLKSALDVFDGQKPEDVLKKLQRLESLKDLNPEKMKAELTKEAHEMAKLEFQELIQKKDGLINTMKTSVEKSEIKGLMAQITECGGIAAGFEADLMRNVKVEVQDGNFKTVFVDANGNPRKKHDDAGNELDYTIKNYISDRQSDETYGKLFTSTSNSGAGGEKNYQSHQKGVKVISRSEAGNYQEEIANGTVVIQN